MSLAWTVPGATPPRRGRARTLTSVDWEAVDRVTIEFLDRHPDVRDRWLLLQTIATSASRRALLWTIGVQAHWRALDLGTGFGVVAHELAGGLQARVVGTDVDLGKLEAAREMGRDLAARGWPVAPGVAEFAAGDAYALPYGDGVFDLATVRFLYQHVDDPDRLSAELARVVRKGGLVCAVDVDDDLALVHPERSHAFERLRELMTAVQEARGGDRRVGRKLAGYLDRGGFDVTGVLVIPDAAYGPSAPGDLGRRFLVDRVSEARSDMLALTSVGEDELDALIRTVAEETVGPHTAIAAHIAVIGQRR